MNTWILPTLAGLLLAGSVHAQMPAAQPTPEQMQAAMARQMQMMAIMFDYRKSRLGFEETVSALTAAAGREGWNLGQIYDMQSAMKQAGNPGAQRMKVINTCPKNANERLAKASQGRLPPLPCRLTVFEGKDSKAYVVRMNTAMLARGLKGEPATIMAEVAKQEDAVLKGIVE